MLALIVALGYPSIYVVCSYLHCLVICMQRCSEEIINTATNCGHVKLKSVTLQLQESVTSINIQVRLNVCLISSMLAILRHYSICGERMIPPYYAQHFMIVIPDLVFIDVVASQHLWHSSECNL